MKTKTNVKAGGRHWNHNATGMTIASGPATIQASFEVDLPRPRKLSSPPAQALREAILKELGL